jgi:outer membrane protein TolC
MSGLKWIGIIGLSFVCGSSAGVAQTLTLTEAVDLALQNSEELHIAREEIRKAQWAAKAAGAKRLPQLDIAGNYRYTSEVMEMVQPPKTVDFGTGAFTIPGQVISFGDGQTAEIKLQMNQPIFTGFGLQKAHQAAQYAVREKEASFEQVRWTIQCMAEELYIRVQKATAWVNVARLHVETLSRHFDDARYRVEQGIAPQEAAARAEHAFQQAKIRLREAEHSQKIAWTALCELLGLPTDAAPRSLESLEPVTPLTLPEDAVSLALNNRYELKVNRFRKDIAEESVGMRTAQYYPSLYAFGALHYGKPGVDLIDNDWMTYGTAGVSLNWTLWDWNQRSAGTQQLRSAVRQIDGSFKAQESKIRREVIKAMLDLEDADGRLEISVRGAQLAGEIQQWVQERYDQGVATEKEYLDALTEKNVAEIDHIIASADYRLAAVALKRACGCNPF